MEPDLEGDACRPYRDGQDDPLLHRLRTALVTNRCFQNILAQGIPRRLDQDATGAAPPRPTRAEAIRRLVGQALTGGAQPSQKRSKKSAAKAREMAGQAMASGANTAGRGMVVPFTNRDRWLVGTMNQVALARDRKGLITRVILGGGFVIAVLPLPAWCS
jgi:hypothetical protein